LFLYSLTFGLTYVLKLFTYLCPETGQSRDGLRKAPVLLEMQPLRQATVRGNPQNQPEPNTFTA
uniref:hypothetical protein n=1 Tax=Faecalicatena contorta TaxID=39482 RepID=UPI001A9B27E2